MEIRFIYIIFFVKDFNVFINWCLCFIFYSDYIIKVWSFDGFISDFEEFNSIKVRVVVAVYDKDINFIVIASNDSYVCSGF